jgi:hypothetical protein
MTEGASAMPDHETQVRVSLERCFDLGGNIVHHIQPWGVGLGFVGDERSAKFEEDKFFHESNLTTKS